MDDRFCYMVIFGCLSLIMGINLFFPIQPSLDSKLADFQRQSMATPCTGILGFYSGKGFSYDFPLMHDHYLGIYKDEGEGSLLPPNAAFYSGTHADCDDFAHWAHCLAGMYGVTCKDVWTSSGDGEHIGVECVEEFANESIVWRS